MPFYTEPSSALKIIKGVVAEWLGFGLQHQLQRFESARHLKKPSTHVEGFFIIKF